MFLKQVYFIQMPQSPTFSNIMKQLEWFDMQNMFLKQVYCIQMPQSPNQSQNSYQLCTMDIYIAFVFTFYICHAERSKNWLGYNTKLLEISILKG